MLLSYVGDEPFVGVSVRHKSEPRTVLRAPPSQKCCRIRPFALLQDRAGFPIGKRRDARQSQRARGEMRKLAPPAASYLTGPTALFGHRTIAVQGSAFSGDVIDDQQRCAVAWHS